MLFFTVVGWVGDAAWAKRKRVFVIHEAVFNTETQIRVTCVCVVGVCVCEASVDGGGGDTSETRATPACSRGDGREKKGTEAG